MILGGIESYFSKRSFVFEVAIASHNYDISEKMLGVMLFRMLEASLPSKILFNRRKLLTKT